MSAHKRKSRLASPGVRPGGQATDPAYWNPANAKGSAANLTASVERERRECASRGPTYGATERRREGVTR